MATKRSTSAQATSAHGWMVKGLLLAAFLTGGWQASQTPAASPESAGAYPFEVRLRKMHLVRPDLIPYPIHTDFYA